jgi:hypothetical protein
MRKHIQRDLMEAEAYFAAFHTNLKKKTNSLGYSSPPANSIKQLFHMHQFWF